MSDLVAVPQHNLERIPRCGAKSKSTGKPCAQPAMNNGRCRLHGGKTPAGIASPHYKHGMRSKFPGLPISMAESFEIARSDPEILNLTDDIALLYARMGQLVEKIDIEDAEQRWKDLREQIKIFNDARARKDGYAYGQALAAIEQLAEEGGKDFMIWNDIQKVMGNIQKLVAQEQKRRMEMHALISTDQAVSFVSEILLAVKMEVEAIPGATKEDLRKALMAIHVKVREALERRPQFGTAVKE